MPIEKLTMEEIVKEVILENDLPANTKAIGFVVHLPDSDEFLGDSTKTEWAENRMWSKIPDLARIFSQKKAIKEAKKYGKNANVTLLLDTGPQFINILCFTAEDLATYYDKNGRRKRQSNTSI